MLHLIRTCGKELYNRDLTCFLKSLVHTQAIKSTNQPSSAPPNTSKPCQPSCYDRHQTVPTKSTTLKLTPRNPTFPKLQPYNQQCRAPTLDPTNPLRSPSSRTKSRSQRCTRLELVPPPRRVRCQGPKRSRQQREEAVESGLFGGWEEEYE